MLVTDSEVPAPTKARRMFWNVLRVVIIVYLCLSLLMCAVQSRLVYFPLDRIDATPDMVGLRYEEVALTASDGVRLAGWFVPAEEPRGVALFCHGNAGNISHRLDTVQMHRGLGLSSFVFDYRGYGASGGKPSEQGTYRDAEAAWRYLTETRRVPAERIVLHGRSLGGPIAAWLATQHTPRALILESTFTSLPDLGAQLYWFLPVRLISRFRYDTRRYLHDVACPVLVVHSPGDDIIPFRHGQRLFEAAREPKTFLEIAGTHNEGWSDSGTHYTVGLNDFLATHLGNGRRSPRPEEPPR